MCVHVSACVRVCIHVCKCAFMRARVCACVHVCPLKAAKTNQLIILIYCLKILIFYHTKFLRYPKTIIIESVDTISRDERDAPLMQYITNIGKTRACYTITHFKHHHRVLWLISNQMSV